MAREVIRRCDKCGEPGEDVQNYTIRMDGQAWEVDLDARHAKPLLDLAAKGREITATPLGKNERPAHLQALERRTRGV